MQKTDNEIKMELACKDYAAFNEQLTKARQGKIASESAIKNYNTLRSDTIDIIMELERKGIKRPEVKPNETPGKVDIESGRPMAS